MLHKGKIDLRFPCNYKALAYCNSSQVADETIAWCGRKQIQWMILPETLLYHDGIDSLSVDVLIIKSPEDEQIWMLCIRENADLDWINVLTSRLCGLGYTFVKTSIDEVIK